MSELLMLGEFAFCNEPVEIETDELGGGYPITMTHAKMMELYYKPKVWKCVFGVGYTYAAGTYTEIGSASADILLHSDRNDELDFICTGAQAFSGAVEDAGEFEGQFEGLDPFGGPLTASATLIILGQDPTHYKTLPSGLVAPSISFQASIAGSVFSGFPVLSADVAAFGMFSITFDTLSLACHVVEFPGLSITSIVGSLSVHEYWSYAP